MGKKSVIGIDFGGNQIKIVEIKKNKVTQFIKEDMPEGIVVDGDIISWNGLYEFMDKLVKQCKFSSKNVRVVLPDAKTHTLRLTTPIMSEKQLDVNIPFEFRDFITGNSEGYTYAWALKGIEQDTDGNDTGFDIVAVAAEKSLIDHYEELFGKIRMKLEMVTPQCLCIETLMRQVDPSLQECDFVLIDLGYYNTRVNIFSNGIFDKARTIDAGCKTIVQKVSEILKCHEKAAIQHIKDNTDDIMNNMEIADICSSIALEVMRAVNYYAYEKQNNTLQTIYVCGGGSTISRVVDELKDSVPLEVVMLSDYTNSEMGKDVLTNGHSAAGICWNGD